MNQNLNRVGAGIVLLFLAVSYPMGWLVFGRQEASAIVRYVAYWFRYGEEP